MWFNIEDGVPQDGGFCNNPGEKFHVIKLNECKNKTTSKGNLFQDECWESIS